MIKASDSHIIGKQTIEINFENISDGFALQNRVADVFYEKLLPQMEMLFDEFANDEHLISFETLQVECGLLSNKHWEDEWVRKTIQNLRQELRAANKVRRTAIAEAGIRESLLFFLRTGRLPWNSSVSSVKDMEQLTPDSSFLEKLKELIRSEEKAADRLVYTFSEEFVGDVIRALFEGREENIADSYRDDDITLPINQKWAQSGIIKKLADDKSKEFPGRLDKRKQDDKATSGKKDAAKEAIYILNAGLVLLHPFLAQLFETIGLVEEQQWNNELSPHTAARVLEYLVTGNDECPEFNLPLNMILCGLAIDEVWRAVDHLSPEIKTECDEMLRAVVQHWNVLKNTSIETLRETFLQRNGKLTMADNDWLLQVEQKGVDVLLSQLPWGIGVIKLPWLKHKLFVEWA